MQRQLVPFSELTDEQVRKLSSDDIEWYKERTALEEGLKIAPHPGDEPRKPQVTADIMASQVGDGSYTLKLGWDEMAFTSAADAQKVMELLVSISSAGRLLEIESSGLDVQKSKQFPGEHFGVKTVPVLSALQFAKHKREIEQYQRLHNEWRTINNAYTEYNSKRRDITKWISERIEQVWDKFRAMQRLAAAWRQYRVMDEPATSLKFFAAAYAEELSEWQVSADDVVAFTDKEDETPATETEQIVKQEPEDE